MKKMRNLIVLSALMMLAAACSKTADYVTVIPADASFVMSVNTQTLFEKSGLKDSPLLKMAMTSVPDDVRSLMEDVDKWGVDPREPAYIFMTPDMLIGVVMKVNSQSDIEDTFSQLDMDFEKGDGFKYATEGNTGLAFNKSAAILLMNMQRPTITEDDFSTCFNLKKEDRFVSTQGYDGMDADSHDLACYINNQNWSKTMSRIEQNTELQAVYALLGNIMDVEGVSHLDFEDGKIVIDGQSKINDKDVAEGYSRILGNSTLKADYLNLCPENGNFYFATNFNGKSLVDILMQNQLIAQYINQIPDVERIKSIISKLDGDIAFGGRFGNDEGRYGSINFYGGLAADVQGTDIVDDINYFILQDRQAASLVKTVGNNRYAFAADGIQLNYGQSGHTLYGLIGNERPEQMLQSDDSRMNRFKQDIKGANAFMFVDFSNIVRQIDSRTYSRYEEIFDMFEYITIASTINTSHCNIQLSDKRTNAFKQIVDACVSTALTGQTYDTGYGESYDYEAAEEAVVYDADDYGYIEEPAEVYDYEAEPAAEEPAELLYDYDYMPAELM
ncbi:MAG: DUF4836 family protein [Paludibacteraceae bacterium]|nr:DUF4836 family protein [Paludibacteraceae bacterium]